jgi:methylglutaconyl-CoA hydratase
MPVDYAVAGHVARITLNRPEKRNALNPEMMQGIRDALARAASAHDVRVILLRGAGPDFCSGLDLTRLAADSTPMDHLADARRIADLFLEMRRNHRPIIGAVHGRALAGGCGLATACDLLVASESAQFRYTEVNIGFVAAIVTALLRRQVGEKHAFEMLAGGEPWSAAQAHRIGMINHVWPDSEFDARAEEYAAGFARKSASAVALTKSLLYHIDGMALETAIQSGVFVNALARGTEDARRGIEQFVQKKS